MNHTIKYKDSFLIDYFIEFYQVLLKIKNQAMAEMKNTQEKNEQMQAELLLVLRKQADKILRTQGSFLYDSYREFQYVMCGYADEVMLFLNWQGKEWWNAHLLEDQLFHTHQAGDQIFDNIGNFVSRNDMYKYSLGSIYLYVLSLGFLGKFAMNENAKLHIDKYKKELFLNIYGQEELTADIINNDKFLLKTDSALILEQEKKNIWIKICLYAIVGYLICSYAMFTIMTYSINKSATEIIKNMNTIINK